MISQAEFVERFRHEIGGMVLDGATAGRSGAELGLFARQILKKVDIKLVEMWNSMHKADPAKPAAMNGSAIAKEVASGSAKR